MFFGASGSIAGGTMLHAAVHPGRHVVRHVEQRRAVALRCTGAAARSSPGSASRRRCGSARPSACAFSGTSESSAAGCGSWTMQTSQPARQLAGVHLVVLVPGRPLLLGEVLRVALERVVHELRGVEELLAAVDDLPLDLEADVAHQRDQRVEDLRHPAAERGGAQVDDALALQRLGELADLLDERATDDVGVVGEALVGRARRAEALRTTFLVRVEAAATISQPNAARSMPAFAPPSTSFAMQGSDEAAATHDDLELAARSRAAAGRERPAARRR